MGVHFQGRETRDIKRKSITIYNDYHNKNFKTMATNKYYYNSFETHGKIDKIRYDKEIQR